MTVDEEFCEWLTSLPREFRDDVLWTCSAYQLATFLAERAWDDVGRIAADPRTRALADQFYRAVGSIGANYAEAYSRRSARDRVRFYEYSLGSARESRDWIHKLRAVVGEARAAEHSHILTRIIQLLTVTINRERRRGTTSRSER